ncbi:MAG: class I SAM-dependent methyltransferase [Chitinophagaceae bacterium]|nr:class I SAM-dependent methyltransferase [Chitinophagaceae bacterium]
MFREESIWIQNALQTIHPSQNIEVANIGSSTGYFRKVLQPHIHNNVMDPLNNSGWKVMHVDMKDEPGVDLVADVTKTNFSGQFKNRFGLTICTNLLEHVEDIDLVIQNLVDITCNNGYVLITVPNKYKIHYDPIDNGFRPTPFEIASRFLQLGNPINVVAEEIITIEEIAYYRIKKSRIPLWGYRDRLKYYLGNRHKVTGILLQVEKVNDVITCEQKVHYRGKPKPMVLKSIKNFFFLG